MESSMDAQVPVSLRDQELQERGKLLATKIAIRDGMVSAKKQAAKEAQAEIDTIDAEISKIAESIRNGYENRAQGDLFRDQALATEALAGVAQAACTCDPPAEGLGTVHKIDCPVHGVNAPAPKREPRTMGACGLCGAPLSEARDHQNGGEVIGWTCTDSEGCEDAGKIAAEYRHAFGDDGKEGGPQVDCAWCGNGPDHELHAPVAEEEGTDLADTATTYGEGGEDEPEEAESEETGYEADGSERTVRRQW